MKYCGIDLSKKSSHYCIMNAERRVLAEGKVGNRPKELAGVFGSVEPMRIIVEASGNAFWIADVLSGLGHEVIVVDPGRTKAIGSAGIKNDKLDARVLATLCQANLLAPVDRPTQAQRYARMPAVSRDALVRSRTSLINAVRGMLHSEGVLVRSCDTDAFTSKVRERPDGLDVPLWDAIGPLLVSIDQLSEQIAVCEAAITQAVKDDPIAKLLRTAPGVGPVVAAQLLFTVRDPSRFRSGRQLAAYLGLVPSLYASGQTYRLGRITKRGNRRARWLMTMAANALLRTKQPSALREWGRRKVTELGRKKAVVAVARKLTTVLWSMWMHQRRFEPRLTAAA